MKKSAQRVMLLLCAGLLHTSVQAQYRSIGDDDNNDSRVHAGFGAGLDFGGVGVHVEYLPVKYVGVFGGIGYNLKDLGLNAGISIRPLPDARIQPIIMGMYGYNAVIKIDGSESSLSAIGLDGVSKTYYGFSAGLGGELKVGHRNNRLYAALWCPFRSQEFHDNYDKVKDSPYLTKKTDILPVAFSIGFIWTL